MPSEYLPENSHVLRYVPYSKTLRDEAGNVVGILGTAFQLRPIEVYLSGSGALRSSLKAAVEKVRASDIDVKSKSAFAYGCVGDIGAACASEGRRIRFVHESADDNTSHAALRGWPADHTALMERLALLEWGRFVKNSDVR